MAKKKCEWKMLPIDNMYENHWKTCDNKVIFHKNGDNVADFKFCPCCGKPIEFKEKL